MADYFSRLLDRARGEAPLLERRTPQPFEAPRHAGAWARESPALVDTETDALDARPAAPPRDAIGAAAARPHPRAETMRVPEHPVDAPPIARPTAAPRNAAVVSAERGDARPAVVAIDVDASLAPVTRDARLPAPRPPHPGIAAPLDAPARLAPRGDEPTGAQGERRERTSSPSRADDVATRVVRAAPIAEVAPAHVSSPSRETRMPIAQVIPRTAPVAAASAERAPAPTIHVSIGRVEVRAVPAPPPARAQSTEVRGPRLSLDSYLRSRTGEGA